MAAPAAAANPRLRFVNGIAGQRVDVCVGTTEVRSNLRYGAWSERVVAPGDRTIRFRRAAAGTCTGNVLGKQGLTLVADGDLTLVVTKLPDKVLVSDNSPLPTEPGFWWRGIRHAADVGEVVVTALVDTVIPTILPDTWVKGEEVTISGVAWNPFWLSATRIDETGALAEGHFLVVDGRRAEAILVGNNPGNTRFVFINRPLPQ